MADRPTFRSWRSYWDFHREVALQRRYVWSKETLEFLDTVAGTCNDRVRDLPSGKIFWRAQLGNDWVFEQQINDEIPAPFKRNRMKPLPFRAHEGRVNPKGIPCLYVSTNRDAAMSEVRPGVGSFISLAQFKIIKDLKVVDCSVHHSNKEIYFEEPPPVEREQSVWAKIDAAFATPVTRSDETADYVSTQILSEKFADLGYDGVVYKSAYGDDAYNLALFDVNVAKQLNCFLFKTTKAAFSFSEDGNPYFIKEEKQFETPISETDNDE